MSSGIRISSTPEKTDSREIQEESQEKAAPGEGTTVLSTEVSSSALAVTADVCEQDDNSDNSVSGSAAASVPSSSATQCQSVSETPRESNLAAASATVAQCDRNQPLQSVDIGLLFEKSGSSSEFMLNLQLLTAAEKYRLLTQHDKPADNYQFPSRYLGGCNHSFRLPWLSAHPRMVYSSAVDGAFCNPCALFCTDSAKP